MPAEGERGGMASTDGQKPTNLWATLIDDYVEDDPGWLIASLRTLDGTISITLCADGRFEVTATPGSEGSEDEEQGVVSIAKGNVNTATSLVWIPLSRMQFGRLLQDLVADEIESSG